MLKIFELPGSQLGRLRDRQGVPQAQKVRAGRHCQVLLHQGCRGAGQEHNQRLQCKATSAATALSQVEL